MHGGVSAIHLVPWPCKHVLLAWTAGGGAARFRAPRNGRCVAVALRSLGAWRARASASWLLPWPLLLETGLGKICN